MSWEDSFTPVQTQQSWESSFVPVGSQQQPIDQSASPNTAQPIGYGDRVVQGLKDTPDAMAQMMLHALPDQGFLKGSAQYLDRDLANQENQYQASRAASGSTGIDWPRVCMVLITANGLN